MIQINLPCGRVALVDDVDADLATLRWHAAGRRGSSYAARKRRKGDGPGSHKISLHLVVAERMGLHVDGRVVDHISGNRFDNRRSNLRSATVAENARNVGVRTNNTSGFKGVSWHARDRRFRAKIKVLGRVLHIGNYTDILAAAVAHDKVAYELFGDFAKCNFPRFACGVDRP